MGEGNPMKKGERARCAGGGRGVWQKERGKDPQRGGCGASVQGEAGREGRISGIWKTEAGLSGVELG